MKELEERLLDGDSLVLPAEVAPFFRVTRRTIRTWVRKGKLQGIKTPGGGILVRWSSVEAKLNGETPL